AGVVTLTAPGTIGAPLSGPATEDVDTDATMINATDTGTGLASTGGNGIWITDAGSVDFTSVTTADGVVVLSAGSLSATSVTAGGTGRNAILTTTSGDLAVLSVTAAGDAVSLTAAGAITDGDTTDDNDVTATNLSMKAASGIGASGSAATLETTVTNLAASGGTGGVFVANTGGLTINTQGSVAGVSANGAVNVSASSP